MVAVAVIAAACSSEPPHAGSGAGSSAPPSVASPSGASASASASGSARPAPPAPARGFAVIGDFGSGNADERAVAGEIRRWSRSHPLDAIVTTGDNVYETGQPSEFDAAWNRPYGWVDRRRLPVVAALGNHDEETSGGTHELELFHMPGRWYARTIGSVRFIVLDANDPTDPAQMTFLRGQLGKRDAAPWTVVVFHQPAYSCGLHQSTPSVDEAWVPLFGRGGVDLVVNGHDHDYERFRPDDGVTYVVDGSGGQTLYPVSSILCSPGTPYPTFADDRHHLFLYLAATPDRLTGRAVTSDGTIVDSFELGH